VRNATAPSSAGTAPWRKRLALAAAAVLPAAAVFLYTVPPTEDSLYPRCPFHALTGLHCPGCGTARCLHALLHGELAQAAAYNIFALVCLPFLGCWAARRAYGLARRRPVRGWLLPAWSLRLLLALVVAYWVLRNVPVTPFTLLAPHPL
jgi:hypothetical protein